MSDRALDNHNDKEGDGRGAALRGGIVTQEELDVALLWVKPLLNRRASGKESGKESGRGHHCWLANP